MRRKIKSNLLFACLCLLIIFITAFGFGTSKLYQYLNKFSRGSSAVEPVKVEDDGQPVNILLMGVDIGDGSSSDKHKRTDTIMLVNYKYSENKVNIISVPRDTLIQVNGKNEKINAAHVLGGVPWVIDSVEKLLDVKINYYGKVNYAGFRSFIDAIGGVEVDIDRDMDYDDEAQNLHIHFNKGQNVHLDGKKAEEFFRWRKNNDGTGFALGDLDRIENQHILIKSVFEKVSSASIILKIPKILEILPEYIETNMDGSDILKYGPALINVAPENMQIRTIKGDLQTVNGVSYFIYDEGKNNDIAALIN
ncbi:LCP family protein [Clostridium thermarum]|uniref:LCP family protein n=1 Tax=Clostridium thermarum TaxID=1716543 RepID=UPI001123712C|nr:LCP family protein [Clostridium thermarum]